MGGVDAEPWRGTATEGSSETPGSLQSVQLLLLPLVQWQLPGLFTGKCRERERTLRGSYQNTGGQFDPVGQVQVQIL